MGERSARLGAAAALLMIALLVSGCSFSTGGHDPIAQSGADEALAVDARADAVVAQHDLLQAAAGDGGTPLAEGSRDACHQGESGWKRSDPAAWSCASSTTWVIADEGGDPAVALETMVARLNAYGCRDADAGFSMAQRYWSEFGVPGQLEDGRPYGVDDLPVSGADCSGASLAVGIRTAGAIVDGVEARGDEVRVDRPLDAAPVRASGAPLVLQLTATTRYYELPWSGRYPEPEPTVDVDELPPCFGEGPGCVGG